MRCGDLEGESNPVLLWTFCRKPRIKLYNQWCTENSSHQRSLHAHALQQTHLPLCGRSDRQKEKAASPLKPHRYRKRSCPTSKQFGKIQILGIRETNAPLNQIMLFFLSYLRRFWLPQRCFSGPQRRTGKASRNEYPQPPRSSFSTGKQSPPWGSHLAKKAGIQKALTEEQRNIFLQKFIHLLLIH